MSASLVGSEMCIRDRDMNEAYFWGDGGQHVFQVSCKRKSVVWSDPTQMRGPPLRMLSNCSR
eukprot:7501057-Alexandrium_andersonii.AAC.1